MSADNISADETPRGEGFELEKIRELISLMEKHGLTEIDLRRDDQRWRLRRGPTEVTQMVHAPQYQPLAHAPAPLPAPTTASAPAAPAAPVVEEGVVIKSPTVGTFYSAAAPGDPPFVTVGTKVSHESVICIIEAMKVFNQITAELNGTITEILAKSGDAVEFGQPLFRVKLG